MPAVWKARAAASGKKYMSLQQVMPPRSISAAASRVPSCTKSAVTCLPSAGQMRSLQPLFQGQIVGQTAHQCHGCVGVQIDEAGQ